MDSRRAISQFKALKKLGGNMRLAAESWKSDWETLISIIMSARTRDETTIVVAEDLFSRYGDAEKLGKAEISDVEKIIKKVNFYKNKAKSIVACSKKLARNFGGKVPHDFDELLKLPGVGRKTANVFLAEFGQRTIGVDTHVNYISNYLGWADSRYPEKVELSLKRLFPEEMWRDLNQVLVRFGKTHTSRRRKNELLDKIKEIR